MAADHSRTLLVVLGRLPELRVGRQVVLNPELCPLLFGERFDRDSGSTRLFLMPLRVQLGASAADSLRARTLTQSRLRKPRCLDGTKLREEFSQETRITNQRSHVL